MKLVRLFFVLLMMFSSIGLLPWVAFAGDDPMDKRVAEDARETLDTGNVNPTLKWIEEGQETELMEAFANTQAKRSRGEDSRETADQEFIETAIKLFHQRKRPEFTGLRTAGTSPEGIVAEAEKALDEDNPAGLVRMLQADVKRGLTEHFARVSSAVRHKDESVEAGRAYVKAYIDYVHFVRDLYPDSGTTHGQGPISTKPAEGPSKNLRLP